MDTDSFFYNIDTEDLYRDIAKYVEEKFYRNGYLEDDNRPLTTRKNRKS